MTIYIFISFLLGVISVAVGMILLLVADFPIERKPWKLQELVFRILVSTGFTLWAAYLLWGQP